MTVASPPAPARSRAARWALAVAVAAAVLLLLALAAPGGGDGTPLHPGSTGATGTKAVLDVVRELGGDVRVTEAGELAQVLQDLPGDGGAVALLLADHLVDRERAALLSWVRAGGTLVVADPSSPLTPPVAGTSAAGWLDPSFERGACPFEALAHVERVHAPQSVLYEVGEDTRGCFRRPWTDAAWLVVGPEGAGTVVALGGPDALVNSQLGRADNGLLAAALLAPSPGTAVIVVAPGQPGEGDSGLLQLIPDRVRLAAGQLALAFVVLAWWRGRRLGDPVAEPQPVAVPTSEVVAAVGRLHHAASARAHAAAVLRADARRTLTRRLGLPADVPTEVIAEALERAGTVEDLPVGTRSTIVDLFEGPDPADDEALVRLAQQTEALRAAAVGSPVAALEDAAPPASTARTTTTARSSS